MEEVTAGDYADFADTERRNTTRDVKAEVALMNSDTPEEIVPDTPKLHPCKGCGYPLVGGVRFPEDLYCPVCTLERQRDAIMERLAVDNAKLEDTDRRLTVERNLRARMERRSTKELHQFLLLSMDGPVHRVELAMWTARFLGKLAHEMGVGERLLLLETLGHVVPVDGGKWEVVA